jgi:nitrite reductase/ring-hydroxylating ferredoxin subunit
VLLGLTTAGVAVVAGCSTDTGYDGSYGAPPAGNAQPANSSSPSPTATRSASRRPGAGAGASTTPTGRASGGAGGGGSAATGLVRTSAVKVGGGVIAGKVLVVQPQAGVFKAYDTACPHQGVPVDAPDGSTISCSAHGSTFKLADGARISGPAARGLKAIPVKVQNGFVVKA